jgi:hypothetical protein
VDTLLGKKHMTAERVGDDEDKSAEFRGMLVAEKAEDPNLGAAVRWTVQATPQGGLRLLLQELPGGAHRLRSEPHLAADEAEAITLESFDAQADIKERAPCRGPIPVLFARDPDAAMEALSERPKKVHIGKSDGRKWKNMNSKVNTVSQDTGIAAGLHNRKNPSLQDCRVSSVGSRGRKDFTWTRPSCV